MYKQVNKSKETERRAVANSATQCKNKKPSGITIMDNRPESTFKTLKMAKPTTLPLQRYWELNQYGQYYENNKDPIGKFYAAPSKQWLSMSKGEATCANLAIALKDAMQSDPGGHIGDSSTIQELTETYSDKAKQTVIDKNGLWTACWALAGATLQDTPITTFKSKHKIAKEKTYENRGSISSATIHAAGWVIESGKLRSAVIKTIRVDQIKITAHLMDDETFQFTIGLLHWSIRD